MFFSGYTCVNTYISIYIYIIIYCLVYMYKYTAYPSQTTPPRPIERSYQGNSAQPSHLPSLPARPLWQGTDCLPGISSPTPTHMAKQARVGSKTTVHHMASANFRWIPLGFFALKKILACQIGILASWYHCQIGILRFKGSKVDDSWQRCA